MMVVGNLRILADDLAVMRIADVPLEHQQAVAMRNAEQVIHQLEEITVGRLVVRTCLDRRQTPFKRSLITLTGDIMSRRRNLVPPIVTSSDGCHNDMTWPPDMTNPASTAPVTTTDPMMTSIAAP